MSSEPIITREMAPLPGRAEDAHKGDVGRVLIIGGCAGAVTMAGAPALAARAALRAGAGMVQMVVPASLQSTVITIEPCATARPLPDASHASETLGDAGHAVGAALGDIARNYGADVVALGPGLGDSITPAALTEFLAAYPGPLVIDADGLNLLSATPPSFVIPQPRRVVLTPHPGEMRQLLSGRGVAAPADRQAAAVALVRAYGAIAVLKGSGTIVTDGARLFVNETGNAGMATAGAGDVLTGVIAALIGQKLAPLEAAILGVYLHGLAGDFAAQELGQLPMTAVDIIDALPDALLEYGQ